MLPGAKEGGVTERGILFSAPMVRALLDGRKTQTRRLVRDQRAVSDVCGGGVEPVVWWPVVGARQLPCPYGQPGDRLWVRETWYDDFCPVPDPKSRKRDEDGNVEGIDYRATHDCHAYEAGCPCTGEGPERRSEWRPSIFMPRWASRVTLEVTEVRVERLNLISEGDARAEGVTTSQPGTVNGAPTTIHCFGPAAHRRAFALLWDAINGERAPWSANPWVWAVSFRRLQAAESP